MGAQNAKADLEEYRAGYPTQQDDPRQKDNLRFYKGTYRTKNSHPQRIVLSLASSI